MDSQVVLMALVFNYIPKDYGDEAPTACCGKPPILANELEFTILFVLSCVNLGMTIDPQMFGDYTTIRCDFRYTQKLGM